MTSIGQASNICTVVLELKEVWQDVLRQFLFGTVLWLDHTDVGRELIGNLRRSDVEVLLLLRLLRVVGVTSLTSLVGHLVVDVDVLLHIVRGINIDLERLFPFLAVIWSKRRLHHVDELVVKRKKE